MSRSRPYSLNYPLHTSETLYYPNSMRDRKRHASFSASDVSNRTQHELERINQKFAEEYAMRKKVLLVRLDSTAQVLRL